MPIYTAECLRWWGSPAKVSAWDARVWPFLLAGFGMFTALGFMQVVIGFVVQDRFGLTAEATGMATGGSLLAAGLGMAIAQGVIVPRSGWAPGTLLRVGAATTVVGYAALIPDFGLWPLVGAVLLVGLGLGVAMRATPRARACS
ncbi:MAG: hypothetical protein Q4D79_02275 [Propionibacteriaceae bacterium]|nr:hypothetical protein [Propionibacteriaceae bacterium]